MVAPVFIAPPEALAAAVVGGSVEISGDEGRHAVTVRRLHVGEPIDVVDGHGRRASGRVGGVGGKDRLTVTVETIVDEVPPQPRVIVVQALLKSDRAETTVELLSEVAAEVVIPWAAARSVAVWREEKAQRGVEKWRRAAAEAGKQSRRSRFLDVLELHHTAAVCALVAGASLAIVLHEEAVDRLPALTWPSTGDLVLIVGPEGGITPGEWDEFVAAGAQSARMGDSVMRASTAGTAAAAVVLAATGRWS